jgi:fructokinase
MLIFREESDYFMTPLKSPILVGFGEALFDLFPHGKVLGGAPLNFAVHAHQVLRPLGGAGIALSRLGDDALGREILRQLEDLAMDTQYLQVDPVHSTGTVQVSFRGSEPAYDIRPDIAWDQIEWNDSVEYLARNCSGVCFGTLAQREPKTRGTLYRFLEAAPDAVRLFDVNLRQHYYSPEILDKSCRHATSMKLNKGELWVMAKALQLAKAPPDEDGCVLELIGRYGLIAAALTRGARGTVLYTPEGRFEAGIPSFSLEPHADSVGAGDACSAGFAVGLILGWTPQRTVALANELGAYVAARAGATPTLPDSIIRLTR